ncbi:MAG: hypothetical protein H7Z18_12775 [Methylophilaceae bacterium]|nr:hypothetical protein [Methylophilaceae bacterium]
MQKDFQGFPPIVGVDGLGILLNKKPSSIRVDRSRKPHTLPPACTPPDTQKPLWIVSDVIYWLRSYKETDIRATPVKKQVGPPTKAERIAMRVLNS